MLSDRAAEYVVCQHLSSDRTLAECAAKWRQAYPADPFTVPEAEAFIQNVLRLRAEGIRPALSVPMAIEAMHRPALAVVSLTPMKAPSKGAAKRKPKR